LRPPRSMNQCSLNLIKWVLTSNTCRCSANWKLLLSTITSIKGPRIYSFINSFSLRIKTKTSTRMLTIIRMPTRCLNKPLRMQKVLRILAMQRSPFRNSDSTRSIQIISNKLNNWKLMALARLVLKRICQTMQRKGVTW
jgi:hypothetical protein